MLVQQLIFDYLFTLDYVKERFPMVRQPYLCLDIRVMCKKFVT